MCTVDIWMPPTYKRHPYGYQGPEGILENKEEKKKNLLEEERNDTRK